MYKFVDIFFRLIDRCEESEKIEGRRKIRDFCLHLRQKITEKPPIYCLATLVEVNKADNNDLETTSKVSISYI